MASTNQIIAAFPLPALLIEALCGCQGTLYSPSELYLLSVLCLTAFYVDLSTCRIPNALTYSVFATSIAVFALRDWMLIDPSRSMFAPVVSAGLLGAGVVFAVISLTWISQIFGGNMIGGGDVKFCVALGLLLGVRDTFSVLLVTHVMAAIFVIVMLFWRSLRTSQRKRSSNQASTHVDEMSRYLPMGGFYAGGVLTVVVTSWLRT